MTTLTVYFFVQQSAVSRDANPSDSIDTATIYVEYEPKVRKSYMYIFARMKVLSINFYSNPNPNQTETALLPAL